MSDPQTTRTPAEAEWLQDEAPKKRGIPKWLLFGCGCGCLVTVAAVAGFAYVLSGVMDPERNWPRLREVLWFEERPTDLELQTGLDIWGTDFSQFQLLDQVEGLQIQVHDFGVEEEAIEQLFEEQPDNVPFGLTEPVGGVLGEMEVQGRTVRTLRFETLGGFSSVEEVGPGIRVDLSTEGHAVMVQIQRMGSKDPPTDEEITDFFAHFDVWRNR